MTRTRSEYRLSPIRTDSAAPVFAARHPADTDRDELAALMLAAYRNSIDDEGEELADAVEAIDQYLETMLRPHSFVVLDDAAIVAASFVVVVEGLHYVDPVMVAPERKHRGLGRAAVTLCLRSLAGAGVTEVRATITDGNTASERLFATLGFTRHGGWQ